MLRFLCTARFTIVSQLLFILDKRLLQIGFSTLSFFVSFEIFWSADELGCAAFVIAFALLRSTQAADAASSLVAAVKGSLLLSDVTDVKFPALLRDFLSSKYGMLTHFLPLILPTFLRSRVPRSTAVVHRHSAVDFLLHMLQLTVCLPAVMLFSSHPSIFEFFCSRLSYHIEVLREVSLVFFLAVDCLNLSHVAVWQIWWP